MEIILLALVLLSGILLVRSVRNEAEQRRELESLRKELEDGKETIGELRRFNAHLLSLASHQVKSPLAGIRGFAEILMEGAYGPMGEKAKEAIGKIKESAEGLMRLIDVLLDVRKAEEGSMGYEFTRADLARIAEEAVEELRPRAKEKNIELTFAVPAFPIPEAWVGADAKKLKLVIRHLIDNAITHTSSGFVNVAFAIPQPDPASGSGAGRATALLSIADSGRGISAEFLPHLFERFSRDEGVRAETPGAGLGLFTARKIMEAHGGKIWAESAGKGKGSKFFMVLRRIA